MTNSLHTLAEIFDHCINKSWTGKLLITSTNEEFTSHDSQLLQETFLYYKNLKINFGDRVIVKVQSTLKSILTMICLWKLGATVIPIKVTYSEKVYEDIGKDAQAIMVISPDSDEIKYLTRKKHNIFHTKLPRRCSGSDLALILYSSGSMGTPKGIMLTHNNVISALNSIVDYLEIQNNDKILCVSPLSFDYGLYQILMAFRKNCTTVLYDLTIQPILLLKTIQKFNITVFPGVPTLIISIERILHLYQEGNITLEKITNTGGHLPEKIVTNIREKLPNVKIYLMYGLTESKRALYLSPLDVDRKPGSVGVPMPGLEAKIFKKKIKGNNCIGYTECDNNEVGCLFVRGPSVMQGYTQTISENGVEIISGEYRDDNWLNTGDLFTQDEEGYFYFKGREKDLIKQAGYCLFPLEIEKLILENNNIFLSAVVCDNDVHGNEIAHLYVQLITASEIEKEKFLIWLNQAIPIDYKPKKISFITSIPLNNNGKVDKKKIKKLYGAA